MSSDAIYLELLKSVKSSVRALLCTEGSVSGQAIPLENKSINELIIGLNAILSNGLRAGSHWWNYIEHLQYVMPQVVSELELDNPKATEMVTIVNKRKDISKLPAQEKTRLWILVSLESRSLYDQLNCITRQTDIRSAYYQDEAFICNEHYTQLLIGCLSQLNRIVFNISLDELGCGDRSNVVDPRPALYALISPQPFEEEGEVQQLKASYSFLTKSLVTYIDDLSQQLEYAEYSKKEAINTVSKQSKLLDQLLPKAKEFGIELTDSECLDSSGVLKLAEERAINLRRKVAELEQKSKEENEHHTSQKSAFEEEIKNLKEEQQKLTTKINELNGTLVENKELLNESILGKEEYEKVIECQKVINSQLESSFNKQELKYETQLKDKINEIESLTEQLEQSKHELQLLADTTQLLRNQLNENKISHQKELENLDEEWKDKHAAIVGDLVLQIAELKDKLETSKDQVTDLKSKIETLQKDNTESKQTEEILKQQLQTHLLEIKQLQLALHVERENKTSKPTDDNTQNDEQIQKYKNRIQQLEREVNAANELVEENYTRMSKELTEKDELCKSLEETILKERNRANQLEEQLNRPTQGAIGS